jgi:hypothetical protein
MTSDDNKPTKKQELGPTCKSFLVLFFKKELLLGLLNAGRLSNHPSHRAYDIVRWG